MSAVPPEAANDRLRLLSANIQAGSSTRAYSDYVTRSWSHVLPNGKRINLDALAKMRNLGGFNW